MPAPFHAPTQPLPPFLMVIDYVLSCLFNLVPPFPAMGQDAAQSHFLSFPLSLSTGLARQPHPLNPLLTSQGKTVAVACSTRGCRMGRSDVTSPQSASAPTAVRIHASVVAPWPSASPLALHGHSRSLLPPAQLGPGAHARSFTGDNGGTCKIICCSL